MSSECGTNFTLTLSQSIQRVTNCVTQFDFHSMEIYVSVKIFVNVVVANILFFIWEHYDEVSALISLLWRPYHIQAQMSTLRDSQILFIACIAHKLTLYHLSATNVTVTLSQSGQCVSNFVMQLNSSSIELNVNIFCHYQHSVFQMHMRKLQWGDFITLLYFALMSF